MANDIVNDLLKSIINNPSEPVVFPTSWEKVEEQYCAEDQDKKEFEENDPE